MRKKEFNLCLDIVRSGDIRGVNKIYNKYIKLIISITERFSLDQLDLENIIVDFFEFLRKKAKDIPYVNNPKKWIKQQIIERIAKFIKTKAETMNMTNFPKHTKAQRELKKAFEKLTPRERLLAILYYGFDYSFNNIAIIVKMPVRDVRIVLKNIFLKFKKLRE